MVDVGGDCRPDFDCGERRLGADLPKFPQLFAGFHFESKLPYAPQNGFNSSRLPAS